jgi:hypothetical protein
MAVDTIAATVLTAGNETYEARKDKLYLLLSSRRLLAVRGRANWTQGSDRTSQSFRVGSIGTKYGDARATVAARREYFRSCGAAIKLPRLTLIEILLYLSRYYSSES